MNDKSVTVIFHPNCKASVDFCSLVKKLHNYNLNFINIEKDYIDPEIEESLNVVPFLYIDDKKNEIYKFMKVEVKLMKKNNKKYLNHTFNVNNPSFYYFFYLLIQ